MIRDLMHAIRLLGRTPLLSGLAVLALALGIGATTSLFSVVHGVLLRPLPYAEAERLVTVAAHESVDGAAGQSDDAYALTGAEAMGLREMTDVFAGVTIVESWKYSNQPRWAFTGASSGERVRGALVDPNFFDVLGVSPRLGRTLGPSDDSEGVVISHDLWRRQFNGAPDALSRTIRLDGVERQVVGVLPGGVRITYPDATDVFVRRADRVIPFAIAYEVLCRLRPGVSAAAATIAVQRLQALGLRGIRPHLVVVPLQERFTGPIASGIWLVAAAGVLLCVTGSANAALLLLTRTARRARASGIRIALGATRWHLLRLVALEHLTIAFLGGSLGIGLAYALQPLVRHIAPATLPRLDEIAVDGTTLCFALAIAILSVAGSAVVSYGVMLQSDSRMSPGQLGGTVTVPRGTLFWRRALLAGQSLVLVVLLSVAGLLLHSFLNVWRIDLGFEPRGVVAVQLAPAISNTRAAQSQGTGTVVDWEPPARRLAQSVSALRMQLQALPGVDSVASVQAIPFERAPGYTFLPQGGAAETPAVARISVIAREVSGGYFDVMRIPIVEGRAIRSTTSCRRDASSWSRGVWRAISSLAASR
jgi:predicted permease